MGKRRRAKQSTLTFGKQDTRPGFWFYRFDTWLLFMGMAGREAGELVQIELAVQRAMITGVRLRANLNWRCGIVAPWNAFDAEPGHVSLTIMMKMQWDVWGSLISVACPAQIGTNVHIICFSFSFFTTYLHPYIHSSIVYTHCECDL